MSTISIAAPPAVPAAATAPVSTGPLALIRGFGVMLGGPLVLLITVTAAVGHTVRALRERRLPRPAAVGVLGMAAGYLRWLRPWMRRWGATDAEFEATPPGSEPAFDMPASPTHAVQIDAPAQAVWPWIAQMGQDRGGFYSYAWLENLAGCRMRNADRIHPRWQQLAVGQTVLLHPASGLKVLHVEPGRALVLESGWSFVVEPVGPASCRLIARFRVPVGASAIAYAMLLELPHFVMERRMLLEIKRRAETAT